MWITSRTDLASNPKDRGLPEGPSEQEAPYLRVLEYHIKRYINVLYYYYPYLLLNDMDLYCPTPTCILMTWIWIHKHFLPIKNNEGHVGRMHLC